MPLTNVAFIVIGAIAICAAIARILASRSNPRKEISAEKDDAQSDREFSQEHQPPAASLHAAVSALDPAVTPISSSMVDRPSNERAYQKAQIRLIKRQIRVAKKLNRITVWAAIVGGIGLLILFGTLLVTKQGADTMHEQMLISERPYLSIGRVGNGPIAEWTVGAKGRKEGLRIWFYNAGNTPAQRVYVNGGDPNNFVHLTLRPAPPKIVGRAVELRSGEKFGVDKGGAWSWLSGIVIPSHVVGSIPMNGFGQQQITRALEDAKQSNTISVLGDFEYVDVFGEYCCEPFRLSWDLASNQFSSQPMPEIRHFSCAPNIPNICEIKGEPALQ